MPQSSRRPSSSTNSIVPPPFMCPSPQYSHLIRRLPRPSSSTYSYSPRIPNVTGRADGDGGYGRGSGRPTLSPRMQPQQHSNKLMGGGHGGEVPPTYLLSAKAPLTSSTGKSQRPSSSSSSSPRLQPPGSVFNVQLRDALYSCTSGMTCLISACERYVESINVDKILREAPKTMSTSTTPSDEDYTADDGRSLPLSSSSSTTYGSTPPAPFESVAGGSCATFSSSFPTTASDMGVDGKRVIKKAVAAFILDIGALRKLHVEETCQAVLSILAKTASSPSYPQHHSSQASHRIPSRPASSSSLSRSNATLAAQTGDPRCDTLSPLLSGLVAAQLLIRYISVSVKCLGEGSSRVYECTRGKSTIANQQGKATNTTHRPPSSSMRGRPSSACPPPLWSRRPSSTTNPTAFTVAPSSSRPPSAAPTTPRNAPTNCTATEANYPRELVQLRNEAGGVMECVVALQCLVDGICERQEDTRWVGSRHLFGRLQSAVGESGDDDQQYTISKEFIKSVEVTTYPKLRAWAPTSERQKAALERQHLVDEHARMLLADEQQRHLPTPSSSRPSTGYTRFRQVPLLEPSPPGSSCHPPPQSSSAVRKVPLEKVLSLDNNQWVSLTQNGTVPLQELIRLDCVPWPTNCLLRICDEVGLPREVVLKVTASSTSGTMATAARTTPTQAAREAITSYLKVLQRRWHPDRFHHALGGTESGGGGGGREGRQSIQRSKASSLNHSSASAVGGGGLDLYQTIDCSSDEDDNTNGSQPSTVSSSSKPTAVLHQATLIAQSINAIRDALSS